MKSLSYTQRFWAKVQTGPDCWVWTASTGPKGYGQFQVGRGGDKSKMARAHRVAWELAYGAIPVGMCVLHKCDNRLCVRPEHLWLGSQGQNMADMDAKGRRAHRGKYLSDEQVARIRARRDSSTQEQLAKEYGVTQSCISKIMNGRRRRI